MLKNIYYNNTMKEILSNVNSKNAYTNYILLAARLEQLKETKPNDDVELVKLQQDIEEVEAALKYIKDFYLQVEDVEIKINLKSINKQDLWTIYTCLNRFINTIDGFSYETVQRSERYTKDYASN